jgi:hypothetical protein
MVGRKTQEEILVIGFNFSTKKCGLERGHIYFVRKKTVDLNKTNFLISWNYSASVKPIEMALKLLSSRK